MHTLAGLVDTHAAAQTALARTNISVVGRPLPVVQALLRTALRAPTPAGRAGGDAVLRSLCLRNGAVQMELLATVTPVPPGKRREKGGREGAGAGGGDCVRRKSKIANRPPPSPHTPHLRRTRTNAPLPLLRTGALPATFGQELVRGLLNADPTLAVPSAAVAAHLLRGNPAAKAHLLTLPVEAPPATGGALRHILPTLAATVTGYFAQQGAHRVWQAFVCVALAPHASQTLSSSPQLRRKKNAQGPWPPRPPCCWLSGWPTAPPPSRPC
jgi:hypothetical protein